MTDQNYPSVAELKAAVFGAWWCDQHKLVEHADGRFYCDACRVNLGGHQVRP